MLVSDCLTASSAAIAQANVKSASDVYEAADKLIKLSAAARADLGQLEEFLFENMYMHKLLQTINKDVAEWLKRVFEKFCSEPELMPPYYRQLVSAEGLQRTVCDYIAGMTDWYSLSMLKDI